MAISTYNPFPPRVWSRVQNQCTYLNINDISFNSIYIPLTNQTIPSEEAVYLDKMYYKGNILQYKNNSSNLTKNQKYSQISKGLWCNRTKCFATQSQTYTNPNTRQFQRVNYSEYPYPNILAGQPNNISGPYQYDVISPYGCSLPTITEGGNLVCGTYANPCTNELIKSASTGPICNSVSDSNVPGNPRNVLCWNNKIQTFYPRQRYIMSNSNSKFPTNYNAFVSAVKFTTNISLPQPASNIAVPNQ